MANTILYLTNDTDLTSVANSIRTKGGTSSSLSYPTGYVNAISVIKTDPILQSKSTSPTESSQTIKPDSGYDGLSQVSVGAISTTYVGSGIARKSSTNLSASGATVTAPAGYYASAASKAVSSGTITNNTSGGTSSGTINRGSQIKIGAGYYSSDAYYTAQSNSGSKTITGSGTTGVDGYANASVVAGSATTPATTVTVAPSISVGTDGKITASNSGTKSVTPTVSAGWVASGSAGTITVDGSNTKQMTTQGATTYNTSTSDRSIASGTYLTGAQTIKAVKTANISAGNIKSGVTIKVGDGGDDDRIATATGTYTAASTISSGQTKVAAGQMVSGYSAWIDNTEIKGSISAQGTTTFNTSTSDQSVASGKYLSGTQTIKAVTTSNISAGNIRAGVTIKVGDANSATRIANVTGTYTAANTVSSGQTAADAAKVLSGYSVFVGGSEVKGSIASKTSSNLSASGATVTAPAGYYSSAATKTIGNGSVTTPATTITVTPSISVNSSGLITASNSGSKSVTPSVSAGYVTGGTAGTITVNGSNTSQLTTQAAATYNTSTSDQSLTGSKYLTGAVTFRGVTTSNLSAGNIKSGVNVQVGDAASSGRLINVTGSYVPGLSFLSTPSEIAVSLSGINATISNIESNGLYLVIFKANSANKLYSFLFSGTGLEFWGLAAANAYNPNSGAYHSNFSLSGTTVTFKQAYGGSTGTYCTCYKIATIS